MTLPIRIGLVDMTGQIDKETVAAVAAALNVQVTRDLPQYWNIDATVSYLPDPRKVPAGVWPVQLVTSLPPGEGGFHLTKHNQPYAKVIASPDSTDWTIDASHETLEMLVDSAGNRLQASEAIQITGGQVVDAPGEFEYLVEVCDPCEADDFAYLIDGYLVSDFITPHYYDAAAASGTRYSFTGAIQRPRQLLQGGYISFINAAEDTWQQILWVDPGAPPQLNTLGPANGASVRVFVENHTHHKAHALREKRRTIRPLTTEKLRTERKALASMAAHRAAFYV
jgi:hypothetical protein